MGVSRKIIEVFSRNNKKGKKVDIHKIYRIIKQRLDDIGFLVANNGRDKKYLLPKNIFVIVILEEYYEIPDIYEKIILRFEYFVNPLSDFWHKGELEILIKQLGLRKIKGEWDGRSKKKA